MKKYWCDIDMELDKENNKTIGLSSTFKGGPGSGNFGHIGRPGQVGGSGGEDQPVHGKPREPKVFISIEDNTKYLQGIFKDKLSIKHPDDPNVKNYIYELSKVPQNILEELAESGTTIFIDNVPVPNLNTKQHLSGVIPRGWPEWKTWDDVSAAANIIENKILLGVGESSSSLTAGHEIGHIVFYKILNPKERESIMNLQSKHYNDLDSYFQQGGKKGNSGTEELFAESFASIIKNGEVKTGNYFTLSKVFTKEMTQTLKKIGIV